jgi:hypothetical protein
MGLFNIMNRTRKEFLERNTDPQIKSYLFGGDPDEAKIVLFRWFDYNWEDKGRIIKGVMLFPYYETIWSEDKIWFVSYRDAEFFVNWYNESYGASAFLIDAEKC